MEEAHKRRLDCAPIALIVPGGVARALLAHHPGSLDKVLLGHGFPPWYGFRGNHGAIMQAMRMAHATHATLMSSNIASLLYLHTSNWASIVKHPVDQLTLLWHKEQGPCG